LPAAKVGAFHVWFCCGAVWVSSITGTSLENRIDDRVIDQKGRSGQLHPVGYTQLFVPIHMRAVVGRGNEMLVVRVKLNDPTVKWSKGTENTAQNHKFASGKVLRTSCRTAPHMPQRLVERKHAIVRYSCV
jgi:hypothetical protein